MCGWYVRGNAERLIFGVIECGLGISGGFVGFGKEWLCSSE